LRNAAGHSDGFFESTFREIVTSVPAGTASAGISMHALGVWSLGHARLKVSPATTVPDLAAGVPFGPGSRPQPTETATTINAESRILALIAHLRARVSGG
jgi:hypothetical protein